MPKQLPEASSLTVCCPEPTSPGSGFTPQTPAQQGPPAALPRRRHTQSTASHTGHSWAEAWCGPLGGLRGPGLSPVSPATDQLGEFRAPGHVNLVWGAEGTAMAQ